MFNLFKHIHVSRFQVLLPATLMVVLAPAMLPGGGISRLFFFFLLSVLFIQSMLAVSNLHSKAIYRRYVIVALMIIIIWLEPKGHNLLVYNIIRISALIFFFSFIIYALGRFIYQSKKISYDLLFISINIYLLMGIVFGNLSMLIDFLLPGAYRFPDYMQPASFADYMYFSFVTMTTVGYGDVLPVKQPSQVMAVLYAIVGQLYIAIVMAIIVGKFISSKEDH